MMEPSSRKLRKMLKEAAGEGNAGGSDGACSGSFREENKGLVAEPAEPLAGSDGARKPKGMKRKKEESSGGGRGPGDGRDSERGPAKKPKAGIDVQQNISTTKKSEAVGMKSKEEESSSGGRGAGDRRDSERGGAKKPNAGIDVQQNISTVVAYSSGMPQRYGYLLRQMTFILPCKRKGKAYECSLNRVETLIRRRKCRMCFFFEWVKKDEKMFCWIFDISERISVQFHVNPAFESKILDMNARHARCAFSLNFCSDEKWVAVKQILEMVFCTPEHETSEAGDHLYVFTRIDDCVYFRNMKVNKLSDIASGQSLVLNEVGPFFCLKLLNIHRETTVLDQVSGFPQNQMKMTPVVYNSLSSKLGSCISAHSLCLNGEKYAINLENGQDLSVFEDYNITLEEFLQEQSFLKLKHIVGSRTYEEGVFVRNTGKSIIRSLFSYFKKLFSSHKCIKMEKGLYPNNIFLKKFKVKFYGVEFVDYEENQAKANVVLAVETIRGCFPPGSIPCDLEAMLDRVLEYPLQYLQAALDDCSLQPAKERRMLLVRLQAEYMTNVKPKLDAADSKASNRFFKQCPYLHTWMDTMRDNTYLTIVANYRDLLGNAKLEKRKAEERRKEENEVEGIVDGKEGVKKEENEVEGIEDGNERGIGELQLSVMRNCDVHIAENAVKAGITPFRLSWTDYIRSFYFPRYLPFLQWSLAPYLKPSSDNTEGAL